jgi:hypothetical protein
MSNREERMHAMSDRYLENACQLVGEPASENAVSMLAFEAGYFALLAAIDDAPAKRLTDHPNADAMAVGAKALGLASAGDVAERYVRAYYAGTSYRAGADMPSWLECLEWAKDVRAAKGWR